VFCSRSFLKIPGNAHTVKIYKPSKHTHGQTSSPHNQIAEGFKRLNSDYKSIAEKSAKNPLTGTKALADGLLRILKVFKSDQKAVEFIKVNSKESSCIETLDDAISATEAASELIINAESELKVFLGTYELIREQKDVLVLMRSTATMLEQLDLLVPKLASIPLSTKCRVSPDNSIIGLTELGEIVARLAITRKTEFPASVRGYLKNSASIVKSTVTFLANLRSTLGEVDKFCSTDSEYRARAIAAIGDMFDDVAKYLVDLGSDFDISDIRHRNVEFAIRLVDSVDAIGELGLGFVPCSTGLNYRGTAKTLLDLADFIEGMGGLDALSNDIGLSFNLEFI